MSSPNRHSLISTQIHSRLSCRIMTTERRFKGMTLETHDLKGIPSPPRPEEKYSTSHPGFPDLTFARERVNVHDALPYDHGSSSALRRATCIQVEYISSISFFRAKKFAQILTIPSAASIPPSPPHATKGATHTPHARHLYSHHPAPARGCPCTTQSSSIAINK